MQLFQGSCQINTIFSMGDIGSFTTTSSFILLLRNYRTTTDYRRGRNCDQWNRRFLGINNWLMVVERQRILAKVTKAGKETKTRKTQGKEAQYRR